jgi:hypothetical protein
MDPFAGAFEASLRSGISQAQLLGVAGVYAFLLGWAVWTDLFRQRTIRDTASLGMLFVSLATVPLLWSDPRGHILWALGITLFVFGAWLVGAYADGDLKIFVAYAFLLGPMAIPVILLSWVLIILYSLPTIIASARDSEERPAGQRLGVAPGGPGIALALPLGLLLFGITPVQAGIGITAILVVVALCQIGSALDRRLAQEASTDKEGS